MKLTERIIPVLYILLAFVVAVIIILIEPIDGVIMVNSLPFKINSWNVVQVLVVSNLVIGVLLIAVQLINSLSVKHYEEEQIDLSKSESLSDMVQESELNLEALNTEFLSKIDKNISTITNKEEVVERSLWDLCKSVDSCKAVLYKRQADRLTYVCGYAFIKDESSVLEIVEGDGLSGQVMKTGEKMLVRDIPKGYAKVVSGLGESYPNHLLILPHKVNGVVTTLVELAFFRELNERELSNTHYLFESMCQKLNLSNL